jgi:hypothetical protein
MINFDKLTDRIRAIIIGNSVAAKDVVMYDGGGAETAIPSEARVFYVKSPNMLILASEGDVETGGSGESDPYIEVNYYTDKDNDKILQIYKDIKKEAAIYLTNTMLRKNVREVQPKEFAHRVKNKKGVFMENDKIKPINHQLKAQVYGKVKYFTSKMPVEAYTIADDLGMTLQDIQPILNNLVLDKKIKSERRPNGSVVYSLPVEEAIVESFSKMYGTKKVSRQTFENVKLIVKHKLPVNEEVKGSRSRQISSIFIECNGERFKFKENYLPGARAMVMHMANGGTMHDKVGSYITERTTQLLQLRSFNRYVTSNSLINEDSSNVVDTVVETISTIKSEFKKLSGVKTYEMAKSRIEALEKEQLDENSLDNLQELFTIKRFDERIAQILPIVKQVVQEKNTYYKKIEEAASTLVKISPLSSPTQVLEFNSENASLGYKLCELANKILEKKELADFVKTVGAKVGKGSELNNFEKAIMESVFNNISVVYDKPLTKNDLKESVDLEKFFDKFDNLFFR